MKSWFMWICAVMIVAATLPSVTLAAGPFDGEWKVIATTKAGRGCLPNYTFPVTIHNGVIRGTVSVLHGQSQVKGRVAKDGSFTWNWRHGTGKLSENAGTGQWETTTGPEQMHCSGALALERTP